jgi:putative ABC transport system ATP-binding protein
VPEVPDGAVIEMIGIGRRFGTAPPVYALRNVNLTVRSGEWVAVIGPSGSGKSTLLNVMGCLDRPSSGTYLFAGEDVSNLRDVDRTALRGREIGFVFQAFHLLSHRTVIENVMMAELYHKTSRRDRRLRAAHALDRVGLSHRIGYPPNRLSGGEQQRVAIARAILGEPAVLLCDEPTGNLDSTTTESILALLAALHDQGLTIVMITHSEHVAANAERRVRIVDGVLSELT